MHFAYPQKYCVHKHCFRFLLELTIAPREIENNAYAKRFGVNKVRYGQCGSGELELSTVVVHETFTEH